VALSRGPFGCVQRTGCGAFGLGHLHQLCWAPTTHITRSWIWIRRVSPASNKCLYPHASLRFRPDFAPCGFAWPFCAVNKKSPPPLASRGPGGWGTGHGAAPITAPLLARHPRWWWRSDIPPSGCWALGSSYTPPPSWGDAQAPRPPGCSQRCFVNAV
jgi:hypothetical protein